MASGKSLPAMEGLSLIFPVFGGPRGEANPLDWITICERYFRYLKTPDEKKVEIASLHLSGDASPWMWWYEKKHGLGSWKNFVKLFLEQFRRDGSLTLISMMLKQNGRSLKQYQTEFLRVAAHEKLFTSDEALSTFFIRGLDEKLQSVVKDAGHKSLDSAMRHACNLV